MSESHLSIFNNYEGVCAARTVNLEGLNAIPTWTTNWNNQPGPDGAGVVSSASFGHGATGCPGAWENLDTTSLA